MVSEAEVLKLVQQLKRSTSLNEQMRILGRSWRTIRGLTQQQRKHLATQVGLSEAEALLEGLGRPNGIAPARLLRAVREAERSRPGELKQLIRGVRDPYSRVEAISRTVDILQEAFVPEPETVSPVQEEKPLSPIPPPAPPVTSEPSSSEHFQGAPSEIPASATAAPSRTPPSETPDPAVEELRHPKVAAPEKHQPVPPETGPREALEKVEYEPEPEMEGQQEDPEWASLQDPDPAPATDVPSEEDSSEESLSSQLAKEASLLKKFRLLHLTLDQTTDLQNKCQVLEAFPQDWSRRRALCALIEHGVIQHTDELIPALNLLARPREKAWCISDFLRRQPQQADRLEQECDELISPANRRLITRLRDRRGA